jgi:hypothetical protein
MTERYERKTLTTERKTLMFVVPIHDMDDISLTDGLVSDPVPEGTTGERSGQEEKAQTHVVFVDVWPGHRVFVHL